jgi:hypothetical protein
MNVHFLRLILKDPGTFFVLGNACLFCLVSPLAFFIMLGTLVLIIASKWCAVRGPAPVRNRFLRHLTVLGKRPYWGLELIGYACLLVALLAMVNQAYLGFICSICFGFANLLLALRLESKQPASNNFTKAFEHLHALQSFTPVLLALLSEPILLIALGTLHAGLAAGKASLWTLPILGFAAFFAVRYPRANKAIPQGCFALCAFWYCCIGLAQRQIWAACANFWFALAYLEIAYQEYRIYRHVQPQRLFTFHDESAQN